MAWVPGISAARQMIRRKRKTANAGDRMYSSPAEAQKQVHEDYLYWTAKLTDSSFQLSFALIAGNWAAFGSVQKIVSNNWAKTSLILVILLLGVNLIGAYVLGQMHSRRLNYANDDPVRWVDEYKRCSGRDPWPFTGAIVDLGLLLRRAKTFLPLASGACFLIALIFA